MTVFITLLGLRVAWTLIGLVVAITIAMLGSSSNASDAYGGYFLMALFPEMVGIWYFEKIRHWLKTREW